MHGHSFMIDIIVVGDVPPERGYLLDYGDLTRAMAPLIDTLDHRVLNEIEGLSNPTAERLARWVWDRLAPNLPLLHQVRVHETFTSTCIYHGE